MNSQVPEPKLSETLSLRLDLLTVQVLVVVLNCQADLSPLSVASLILLSEIFASAPAILYAQLSKEAVEAAHASFTSGGENFHERKF